MALAEEQVKRSVILMDRLGPDNFSTLQMKGHVLHRARAHLRCLPRVFTNTLAIERELEKETWLIILKFSL